MKILQWLFFNIKWFLSLRIKICIHVKNNKMHQMKVIGKDGSEAITFWYDLEKFEQAFLGEK